MQEPVESGQSDPSMKDFSMTQKARLDNVAKLMEEHHALSAEKLSGRTGYDVLWDTWLGGRAQHIVHRFI